MLEWPGAMRTSHASIGSPMLPAGVPRRSIPPQLAQRRDRRTVNEQIAAERRKQLVLRALSDRVAENIRAPRDALFGDVDPLGDQRAAAGVQDRVVCDQRMAVADARRLRSPDDPASATKSLARRLRRAHEKHDPPAAIHERRKAVTGFTSRGVERRQRSDGAVEARRRERPCAASRAKMMSPLGCHTPRAARAPGQRSHCAIVQCEDAQLAGGEEAMARPSVDQKGVRRFRYPPAAVAQPWSGRRARVVRRRISTLAGRCDGYRARRRVQMDSRGLTPRSVQRKRQRQTQRRRARRR
jgi:hypothetical protein